MNWTIERTEYLHRHWPYCTLRRDACVRPDGIHIPAYYVVEMPPAVITFGLTTDKQVILIEQYRHPVASVSLELPGGFVEETEEPETAAQREMEEETGYRFTSFQLLGKIAGNPGILNNFTYMFLALNGEKHLIQNPDVQEDIRVKLMDIQELKSLLLQNKIIQSLHASACFYALHQLREFN